MNIYNDALNEIIDMIKSEKPNINISVGALPDQNGLSISWTAGAPSNTFFTKNSIYDMTASVTGKNSDEQAVCDLLNEIQDILTRTKIYPETDQFQILNIKTICIPCFLEYGNDSQWLYGSSIQIKFYYRR